MFLSWTHYRTLLQVESDEGLRKENETPKQIFIDQHRDGLRV